MVKTLVVAALAAALFLPVQMIRDLVAERQARHNEAVAGIAEGWGKRQTVAGPYLALPYERRWTEVERETVGGKVHEKRTEHRQEGVVRLPATSVLWRIDTDIGEKARGIYKARLYTARLSVNANVAIPARRALEDGTSRYGWGTPRLVLGVSDPLGIRAAPQLRAGGDSHAFVPGSGDAGLAGGLHAPLAGLAPAPGAARTLDFSFALELLVEAGRLDEGHRDRLRHAAARDGAARRGAPLREARHPPVRAEALGAELVARRQKATLERRMRPVGAHRH